MTDRLIHLVITRGTGAGSCRGLLGHLLLFPLLLQGRVHRRFVHELTRCAAIDRRVGHLFRELFTAHDCVGRIDLAGALNARKVHVGIHLRSHRPCAENRLQNHHNAIAEILLKLLSQTIVLL